MPETLRVRKSRVEIDFFLELINLNFRTDADADALAKYVIALIKKPLSDTELEKLCLDKLFVFLQSSECYPGFLSLVQVLPQAVFRSFIYLCHIFDRDHYESTF